MRCVRNWRRNVGRMGKGGECDDLVRFLFDLFCGRLLLQLLLVCIRKLPPRAAAFAALSRTRGRALAHGTWSGGARAVDQCKCELWASSGAWPRASYRYAV